MENWAYGFSLNHEGAGVGTIYYSAKYFERKGIVNPANGQLYSTEEINKSIIGISEKVLTENLRELESDSIINRKTYAVVPPKVEYSLSSKG